MPIDAETKIEIDKLAQAILALQEQIATELRKPIPVSSELQALRQELLDAKKDLAEIKTAAKGKSADPAPVTPPAAAKKPESFYSFVTGNDDE